ncbi:MAG: AAA family ATPase [archaeon GB-1867-005]|nr:AAA family ATPase [Candidatus Culexmicrobium cathedralense]
MKPNAIATGHRKLDRALNGGINIGKVTLIYGEAGTGKTAISLSCSATCALLGLKAIYLTSEKPFPAERLATIVGRNLEKAAKRIVVIELEDFEQQLETIEKLEFFITPTVGLVVVDTITARYREAISRGVDSISANKSLSRQLAMLRYIAERRGVAVIVTGQVREVIGEDREEVVASKVMQFWPNTIIRLEKIENRRIAFIEKSENKDALGFRVLFKITSRGIEDGEY